MNGSKEPLPETFFEPLESAAKPDPETSLHLLGRMTQPRAPKIVSRAPIPGLDALTPGCLDHVFFLESGSGIWARTMPTGELFEAIWGGIDATDRPKIYAKVTRFPTESPGLQAWRDQWLSKLADVFPGDRIKVMKLEPTKVRESLVLRIFPGVRERGTDAR